MLGYAVLWHMLCCAARMCACRQLLDSVEVAAAQKQERLEAELHSHKTNLIKESIRLSHNDLGDFFYNRGDLQVSWGPDIHNSKYAI